MGLLPAAFLDCTPSGTPILAMVGTGALVVALSLSDFYTVRPGGWVPARAV